MPRPTNEQLQGYADARKTRCGYDHIGSWERAAALELIAAREIVEATRDRWCEDDFKELLMAYDAVCKEEYGS